MSIDTLVWRSTSNDMLALFRLQPGLPSDGGGGSKCCSLAMPSVGHLRPHLPGLKKAGAGHVFRGLTLSTKATPAQYSAGSCLCSSC